MYDSIQSVAFMPNQDTEAQNNRAYPTAKPAPGPNGFGFALIKWRLPTNAIRLPKVNKKGGSMMKVVYLLRGWRVVRPL
jgi:hypothetical protein